MKDALRDAALTFGFWAYRLVVLNIYFLIFFLAGFGIFGLLPATLGVYHLIHRRTEENPWAMFQSFWAIYKENFLRCIPLSLILVFLLLSGGYSVFLIDANLERLVFSHYLVLLISLGLTLFMVVGILTFSLALNMKLKLRLMDNLKLTLSFMVTRFYIPLIILLMSSALMFIFLHQVFLFYAIGIPSFMTISVMTLEQFFFPVLKKMALDVPEN